MLSPIYLLATKLEAFAARGGGDLYASHDFEDIIALIDNRAELVTEMAGADLPLKDYAATELRKLIEDEAFDSAGEGALAGGSETRERFELIVRPRLMTMAHAV